MRPTQAKDHHASGPPPGPRPAPRSGRTARGRTDAPHAGPARPAPGAAARAEGAGR
ncbi:hypothetical protein GCM10010129_74470 [Streptomyces fumigatiscleroticus]|nr:hypothetical protein GCM10010129_74470 [Streptomyces fumigatiscleroticus]